ncbi:MAG: 6-bladed beta-propeller [Gemmatimonadales bacterium]|nr:6-bladed beta-propeller [Gemmatimonadales bacterium]
MLTGACRRSLFVIGMIGCLHSVASRLGAQQQGMALVRERTVDAGFGGVGAIAVDHRGRLYVSDFMSQHILVFSSDGVLTDTIGRSGRGPGEYTAIGAIVIGRGDTLFTLDLALRRITAYSPGKSTVAYTLSVPRVPGQGLANLLLAPSSGFVVGHSDPYQASAPSRPEVSLRLLGADGTLAKRPLFTVPRVEALIQRLGKNSTSVGPLPYGRESFAQLGLGDRIYWNWSGSLRVVAVDRTGASAVVLDETALSVPVHQADLDLLIGSYENPKERDALRLALRGPNVPQTKPATRAMVVDDRGRIWVGRIGKDDQVVMRGGVLSYTSPTGTMSWEVLDGERRERVSLPEGVLLRVVRGGKAYGVERDADGLETIVVFAVRSH